MKRTKRLLCLIVTCLVGFGCLKTIAVSQLPSDLLPSEMAKVDGGRYSPLYRASADLKEIVVTPYLLDQRPVTNAEFKTFVTENPKWQRSKVKRIFAEQTYLRQWHTDVQPAQGDERRPVTNVSWFAAKAYCAWKQKRLPTVAEWEFAAAASETLLDGRGDPQFMARVVRWHSEPNPEILPEVGRAKPNYWGIYDLFGAVWEWVDDFNSMLVTGESREDGGLNRDFFCGAGSTMTAEQAKINYPAFLRSGFRSSLQGNYTTNNLGFRCAKDIR